MIFDDYNDSPVRVYCPKRNAEETVFYVLREEDGKQVYKFNGCESGFCDCPECNECFNVAYKKLLESLGRA